MGKHAINLLRIAVMSIQAVSLGNVAEAGEPVAQRSEPAELSTCDLPGLPPHARCRVLNDPENPHDWKGRQILIHVVIIPATHGHSLPDPLVALMGGPGEDAIGAAEDYAEQFKSLLDERDLLLIDQRGTGRSGALTCDLYSQKDAAANLRASFHWQPLRNANGG